MSLEATRNRLNELAKYDGKISLEGDMGTEEIVIRIPFYNAPDAAEAVYNSLVDIEEDEAINGLIARSAKVGGEA
ncbi:MAG: hypothetical protein JRI70_09720 [Deltaproteobacteria bacterium]|nr:hypothetical protein [Deltaproteobacteria bacterium]